jgi:hypothetical protein
MDQAEYADISSTTIGMLYTAQTLSRAFLYASRSVGRRFTLLTNNAASRNLKRISYHFCEAKSKNILGLCDFRLKFHTA